MVNLKAPVFLFGGDDVYSKDKALKDLANSFLDDSSRELDYRIFYGDEASATEIIDFASTSPFLAKRRLVVVEDFERLPKEDITRLIEYIRKPSDSTCLVLKTADNRASDKISPVKGALNIQHFGQPDEAEMAPWIKKFLKEKGKDIEDEALSLVIDLRGEDILQLSQELEKLAVYSGKNKTIRTDDVEEVIGRGLSASVFQLADAIGEQRMIDSLKMVNDLVSAGKKHYEIIGLLCWHFKRIMKAKILQAKGESDFSITGILKVNRRSAGVFFKQVRRFGIPQLSSKMEILLDADLNIKRTKYGPSLALEFAIIKLCLG